MGLPRIFGWSADSSGCGFYRIEMPLAEYARRGGQAEWSTEMPDWAREDADVIVGQRVGLSGASRLWQELCRKGRSLMVLELDDDLWNIDTSNTTAFKTFTPQLLDNLSRNVASAHVVTVTTEALAEVIRPMNTNVVVVPNRIPAWLLEHDKPAVDDMTIGWAGSGSHAMDWDDAVPQVGRFLKRNPEVHCHIVGGAFRSMASWPLDQLRVTHWMQSVEDYYRVLDFDVGLAPLRAHIFNKSKSNLKALEYAALGIPVVASSVGPYEAFIKPEETGLLVRHDHEWDSRLRALTGDTQMRTEMGHNARQLAAQHTIEGNLESWLGAWQVNALVKA
jgi:glycosyltransferase involved in cell wall biosynthesis